MKKAVMISLLGMALAGLAGTAVKADDAVPVQRPTSIKLGVYLPTGGGAKDVSGSTVFAAGIDYAFSKTADEAPIEPLAYFDYAGGSKNGGHVNLYSLGV